MAVYSFKAVLLDGTDEYVNVGDVTELQFDFGDTFSISAWFKTTASPSSQVVVSKAQDSGDFEGYVMFVLASGAVLVRLEGTAGTDNKIEGASTTTGYNDGRWHHYVITYDGSSTLAGLTVYVDDVAQTLTSTFDAASGSLLTTVPFQIGARNTGTFFNGTIDDVAVYDIELSAGQVTTIYNGGNPNDLTVNGPTGNLVGYWRMGDGDTYPTLTDNSASGNDGTMTNTESTDIVNANGGDFGSTGFGLGDIVDFGDILTPGLGTSEIGLGGGAGGGTTQYFKMRALQDPGPGYHVWTVTGSPDFAGTNAPGAILGGTAIITDTWTIVA